jgi:hypothetical protein
MIVRFTTTCAIGVYHHWSWWGVLETILCDKVCLWFATGRWFSPGNPVSSTNKTDCHYLTEILWKVALNTTSQKLHVRHTPVKRPWPHFYGWLTLSIFYAPATIGRGAYCFTPVRPSVRPSVCSSHLICIVCPANSSYGFWARHFIFCRQLVLTCTLKVCIFYGFWLSTIFYKIMDAWT